MMDKDEPFVYDEVDYKTPKQNPKTWPVDKICRGRFQHKMSSLLNPVTPKRNYNSSNAKSLLWQCLRDMKSDSLPGRRYPVSCSDESILMDGVLVTSATKKKVSESPSSYAGQSAHSPIFRSRHKKNTEVSSPISESGCNKETTRSQQSYSAGKGKMLASSPCTPKTSNPSKLQASAEPFILTPRQASPFPLQPHSCNPQFPGANHMHQQRYPYLHRPRPLIYLYQRPLLLPLLTQSFVPASEEYDELFPLVPLGNQVSTRKSRRINSHPTTPSSRRPNTTTSNPPVHTPISTPPANVSTSTTTTAHGSSASVDGLDAVTQIPELSSSTSDGVETVTEKPNLAPPSDGLERVTPQPDLTSPAVGLESMTIKEDWSPSDDGLPTFTEDQLDSVKSQNRLKKRLSAFKHEEEEEEQ